MSLYLQQQSHGPLPIYDVDGVTSLAEAACPADAVQVRLTVRRAIQLGQVVVHHQRYLRERGRGSVRWRPGQ